MFIILLMYIINASLLVGNKQLSSVCVWLTSVTRLAVIAWNIDDSLKTSACARSCFLAQPLIDRSDLYLSWIRA